MPADGSLTVGASLIDRRYHGYAISGFDQHSALVEFASIGFLPFVEVDLRLTRATGVPRQALGDRMVSVRARILKEGDNVPAVAVGVHDLVGTHYFHSIYAVASKTAQPLPGIGRVGVHLGYGGNLLSLKAEGVQFDGMFGGVSVAPRPWVTMMAEYDAERVNAGVRLRAGRLALLLAAQHLDGFSGGVSYTHRLK
jgi:hypothetical protein